MKKSLIVILGIMVAGCNSPLLNKITGNSDLPPGAIQKGTLGNETLVQDALVSSAFVQLKVVGCDKPVKFDPYVAQMPQGQVGSRVWKELWYFTCKNGKTPLIKMTFAETATGVSFAASE